jgi:hypothetical protein
MRGGRDGLLNGLGLALEAFVQAESREVRPAERHWQPIQPILDE